MTTVVPFPARALLFPAGPLANAHGFPPVQDERPTIDICGHIDGFAVLIRGRQFQVFATLSNASRCAAALMSFDALGLLDRVTLPSFNDGAA